MWLLILQKHEYPFDLMIYFISDIGLVVSVMMFLQNYTIQIPQSVLTIILY